MAPALIDSPPTTAAVPASKLAAAAPVPQDMETRTYGDWRDDFFRDGFVVLKGVVPKERATQYQSEALSWLEGFKTGFDRNDKSTWKKENLPQSWKGGMYLHFAAAHEKYVWDVRW